MINFCIETGVTICEEIVLLSLIEFLCGKKYGKLKQTGIKIIVAIAVAAFIIWMNNTVSLFSFLTLIIGSFIPAFAAKFFCSGKFIQFMSISIMYFLAITIVDILILFITEYFFIQNFAETALTTTGLERNSFIIFSKIMLVSLYFIFTKLFKYKAKDFSTKMLIFLDCSSVLYYVCLNVVLESIFSDNITTAKNSIIVSLLFMIVFLVSSIIFIKRYSDEKQRRNNYKMAEYQKDILEKNYLSLNEMYKTNARNMHDYRNHVLTLQGLIHNKKYDNAEKYLDELYTEINKDRLVRTYTGVEIVDAVLNVKVNDAARNNINMDVNASYPNDSRIKQTDICAILGNLIDNAIEACLKIDDERMRLVLVRISYSNNIVFIKIKNSVLSNPFDETMTLETTKEDKQAHGLGLTIVKNALEKYSGDLSQSFIDDMFVTEVILYCNNITDSEK